MQLSQMQKNGNGKALTSLGQQIYKKGVHGVVRELLVIEAQVKITDSIIPAFYVADLLEYILVGKSEFRGHL